MDIDISKFFMEQLLLVYSMNFFQISSYWRRNILHKDVYINTCCIFLYNTFYNIINNKLRSFYKQFWIFYDFFFFFFVIFNSSYLAKMNPIEKLFGFWKTRARDVLSRRAQIDEIAQGLTNCFMEITAIGVSSLFLPPSSPARPATAQRHKQSRGKGA